MDDNVTVVHQHPVRVGKALTGAALDPGIVHGLVNRIDDGVDVAIVRAGGQQEHIGQAESLGDINCGEVLRLLVGCGTSRGKSQTGGMFSGGHGSPSGSQASCSGDCTVRTIVIRPVGSTPQRPRRSWHWRCYCRWRSAATRQPR